MKQTVLGDTGPLYAAADPDDQYHARAQRELNELATQQTTVILAYPTRLEALYPHPQSPEAAYRTSMVEDKLKWYRSTEPDAG